MAPLVTEAAVRVLHVDHSTEKGGAEYALLRLLLTEPSWRPTLALPRGTTSGVFAPAGDRGVPIEHIGVAQHAGATRAGVTGLIGFGTRVMMQAFALRASRALRETDVVHANTSRAAVIAALALSTSSRPLIVHMRDMVTPESLGSVGFRLMTRVALPRATGLIAASQSALDSALPFLRRNARSVVIPSAIGAFPRADRPDERPTVRRVGMVARLSPWKGQLLLLDAFARAFGGSEVRLVLAGSPAFGETTFPAEISRRARELGVEDRVDLAGHVEDVSALLNELDICVQASTRPEPLGQNVLQYLAAGRPTVVADEGGPAEWVSDGLNGSHFRANDVDDLARVLTRLAADRAFRTRLARSAALTEGLVDDVEIARRHGEFFSRVASEAHG